MDKATENVSLDQRERAIEYVSSLCDLSKYHITLNCTERHEHEGVRASEYEHPTLIDSGANIVIITMLLARTLQQMGVTMRDNTEAVVIQTADKTTQIGVDGWMEVGGYIGQVAVVEKAFQSLLSPSLLQNRGMGINFHDDKLVCTLYTQLGVYLMIPRCERTNMYYLDLLKFIIDNKVGGQIEVVATNMDGTRQLEENDFKQGLELVQAPQSARKRKPTHDISFRVWSVHRRFYPLNLIVMMAMASAGLLGEVDWTPEEVALVRAHQECYWCALKKWNQVAETLPTGIYTTLIGWEWSMDYEGPYAPKAIGGFNGEIICCARERWDSWYVFW